MYNYLLQSGATPQDLEKQGNAIEESNNKYYAKFNEMFQETQ